MTSAVASECCKYLFTSGKEGSIIKWDLTSGKKLAKFHKVRPPKIETKDKAKGKAAADIELKGHTDEVLALALSGDGKYLASAGRDRKLVVWDTEKGEWAKAFSGHLGHKDLISVSYLGLRNRSFPDLFSCNSLLLSLTTVSGFPQRNASTLHGLLRPYHQIIRSISFHNGIC